MDNKQIEGNIFVPAHIDDVWRAWTTESGLRSFLAPECLMVPEPNGPFEIYFRPDAPLGERGSEGCRVMAVMPHDLLSFSWNFPPHLPHIRQQKTQVSLRFVPEGQGTRLHFLQTGWAKLKKHTGVNYRQIPQAAHTDALSLLARHVAEWELVDDTPKAGTVQAIVADWVKKIEEPNGYPAMLFEPIVEAVQRKMGNQPAQPDAARTKAAFDAASQAAASVQSAVFNAVLSGNDEWKYSRWVLAFIDDSAKGSPAYVRQLEHGSFTTTWPRLVRDVANGECMCTSAELLDMAAACMQRLQQRGGPARLAA